MQKSFQLFTLSASFFLIIQDGGSFKNNNIDIIVGKIGSSFLLKTGKFSTPFDSLVDRIILTYENPEVHHLLSHTEVDCSIQNGQVSVVYRIRW